MYIFLQYKIQQHIMRLIIHYCGACIWNLCVTIIYMCNIIFYIIIMQQNYNIEDHVLHILIYIIKIKWKCTILYITNLYKYMWVLLLKSIYLNLFFVILLILCKNYTFKRHHFIYIYVCIYAKMTYLVYMMIFFYFVCFVNFKILFF